MSHYLLLHEILACLCLVYDSRTSNFLEAGSHSIRSIPYISRAVSRFTTPSCT